MKLFRPTLYIFLILIIFFITVSYAFALPIEEGPLIDRGDGYAVGAPPKKNASKTYEELLDSLFGYGNKNSNSIYISPTPIITTILQPVTPNITPGYSNTQIGQLADRIVQVVHSNCSYGGKIGVVASGNVNCLGSLNNVINAGAIAEMRISASSYQYLQCVGCARAMGKATNVTYPGYGNAKQHAGQRVAGYTSYYRNSPSEAQNRYANFIPGSMFIMTGGAYGHIGYVTAVNRDSNGNPTDFEMLECNAGSNGLVRRFTRPFSQIQAWQKPNSI